MVRHLQQLPACQLSHVVSAGNLVHLQVMGRSILLVNDPKIASDLFEKRSAINSSRPTSQMTEM